MSFAREPKGALYEAKPLDFMLVPPPDAKLQPLGQVLLQKRDGSYVLVLWQQVSVYDAAKKVKLENPPIVQTFELAEPFDVAQHLPNDSTTPIKTHKATKSFKFDVPDRVLVMTLSHPK